MNVKQMKKQGLKGVEQMRQSKINEKKLSKRKMKRFNEKGITLVALVVTIIIMLILAGIALNVALRENGLFDMSKKSTDKYKEAQTNEAQEMKSAEDELKKLTQGITLSATIDGKTEEITKENFGQYLGMKVTNFKDVGEGTEDVEVQDAQLEDEGGKVKVSTIYRLYYIDFDNKYGDGAGTIYLKADCTNNNYNLTLDTTTAEDKNVKIKQLNPSLYAKGKETPTTENMQAVTWLLNAEKWANLKDTVKQEIKDEDQINYIVGAPSLEMMMDSYNTHYNLTGDTPEPGDITSGGNRKKLFYKYEGTTETSKNGYQMGPAKDTEYGDITADYTIQTDPYIDSMYYPGDGNWCWLASPSASYSNRVCTIAYNPSSHAGCNTYSSTNAFCPLVSIKSSFNLQLKGRVS